MVAVNEAFDFARLLRVNMISAKRSFTAVNVLELTQTALARLSMYPDMVFDIWLLRGGVVSKPMEGACCCAAALANSPKG